MKKEILKLKVIEFLESLDESWDTILSISEDELRLNDDSTVENENQQLKLLLKNKDNENQQLKLCIEKLEKSKSTVEIELNKYIEKQKLISSKLSEKKKGNSNAKKKSNL